MHPFQYRFVALLVCFIALISSQTPDTSINPDPLGGTDQAMADQLTSSVLSVEWLGVLAPIAISPFFGIACLAGMSQFGGEFLGTNSFISTNPVLNNPVVFWVFLGLTLLTSLPRLTKVSKPLAQALDQVEAYSGIVTLLVIRFVGASGLEEEAVNPVVMQMGVLSFTGDLLMSIAAIVNIVVINTVKFFFEIMVWLVPIPFVDAMLEAANKAACAGLMTIYAISPLAATVLNLTMFAVCLFAYFWIHRRVDYARVILCDPGFALIRPSFGVPTKAELIVFPTDAFGSFTARSKLIIRPMQNGWKLTRRVWFLPVKSYEISDENSIEIETGMLTFQLRVTGPDAGGFDFSRRYAGHLNELANLMNFQLSEKGSAEAVVDPDFV